MHLKKPYVIIFDWDDTLVESGYNLRMILYETLQEMGINSWDKALEEKYRHYALRDSLPLIFGNAWQTIRDNFYKKIRTPENIPNPIEGASCTLQYLANAGVTMVVVSNKNGIWLREEVEKLEWQKYFHAIVGSADANRDKPWPDPVLLALKDLDIRELHEIWFLGDSVVDMQCASNIGCIPILFGNSIESIIYTKQLNIRFYEAKNHQQFIMLHRNTA